MKIFNSFFFVIILIVSHCSFANTVFKSPESGYDYKFAIENAEKVGLSRAKIDNKQTFSIISDTKNIGTLIQGKGWIRDVHSICFINWSTPQNPNAFFMQTMGADDWELVDCDKVESVGTISKPGDKEVKIAIFYRIYARVRYTEDYVVLGLKNNNEIYYDKKTTERFQNVDFKNIAAMRKEYQSTSHNN